MASVKLLTPPRPKIRWATLSPPFPFSARSMKTPELGQAVQNCTPERTSLQFYLMQASVPRRSLVNGADVDFQTPRRAASPRNALGIFIQRIGRNAKFRFPQNQLHASGFDPKPLVPTPSVSPSATGRTDGAMLAKAHGLPTAATHWRSLRRET